MAITLGTYTARGQLSTASRMAMSHTIPTTSDRQLLILAAIDTGNAGIKAVVMTVGSQNVPLLFNNAYVNSGRGAFYAIGIIAPSGTGAQTITLQCSGTAFDMALLAQNMSGTTPGSLGARIDVTPDLSDTTFTRTQVATLVAGYTGASLLALALNIEGQTSPGSIFTSGWYTLANTHNGQNSGSTINWCVAVRSATVVANDAYAYGVTWVMTQQQYDHHATAIVELIPGYVPQVFTRAGQDFIALADPDDAASFNMVDRAVFDGLHLSDVSSSAAAKAPFVTSAIDQLQLSSAQPQFVFSITRQN